MDGMDLTIKPAKFFNVMAYAGIPRYIEQEDIDGNLGFVSGLSLRMKEYKYTKAKIDFTYQKKDFSAGGLNLNDKMYAAASLSKGISIFKLYGLGEYDLTETLPTALTAGTEIYPFVKKISFLLEGSYFNESRNDNFDSIFTIFSEGALWQGRSGFAVNVIKNLSLSDYFSFQRYEVLPSLSKNGYNNSMGASYLFKKIKLETALNYNFYKSYGGTLHGFSLSLYEDWTRDFYTRAFVDFITYTKVTNNDDKAFDALLEVGYQLRRGLRLAAVAEYVNNNVRETDLKGTIKLNYLFDTKFLGLGLVTILGAEARWEPKQVNIPLDLYNHTKHFARFAQYAIACTMCHKTPDSFNSEKVDHMGCHFCHNNDQSPAPAAARFKCITCHKDRA